MNKKSQSNWKNTKMDLPLESNLKRSFIRALKNFVVMGFMSLLLPNLALAQTATLSGTISLAAGEVADGDMDVSIVFDSDEFFESQTVTIPDQASQVEYSIDYPVPNAGEEVVLSFNCQSFNSNCNSADGNLRTFFFLQDDGAVSSAFNSLPVESLAAPQDLTFPAVPIIATLSGMVSLPVGEVADGDVGVTITLGASDFSFFESQTLVIPDQASQVAYGFNYPAPATGTEVQLVFYCEDNVGISNCDSTDGGLGTRFYCFSSLVKTMHFSARL